jgi:hypothetical protein
MLADVLTDVREADVVREATAVLEDADATDEAGGAMLQRVLTLLDTPGAATPPGLPF